MSPYVRIKKIVSILCAASMVALCSCTRLGAPIIYDNAGTKANTRLEQVIQVINSKDKEALRAMFSEQALSEAEDLNGRMDYLFQFVQGNIVSWKEIVAGATDASNNHGHKVEKSTSWYSVKTDKEEYYFYLIEYMEDTDHPENVGLYMLQVLKMKDVENQSDGGDKICAGIYKPDTNVNDDGNASP